MEENKNRDLERMLEQSSFLLKLQEESRDYCKMRFKDLLNFINEQTQIIGGGEEADRYKDVADKINEHYLKFLDAVGEDIEFLKEQISAAQSIKECQDPDKLEELKSLFLDDEELKDTEEFEKEVLAEAQEAKAGFVEIIDDLKSAIEEGNLDEVLVYLQEIEDAQREEELGEDEEMGEDAVDIFDWIKDMDEDSCDEDSCSSCPGKSKCHSENEDDEDEK